MVWIILGIELVSEFLIRPSNYHMLTNSDKAFAPTTARHINRYHLVCEAIALLLFIPQLWCVFGDQCGHGLAFSGIDATLSALTSDHWGTAALGRFCMGLTFLRSFGLVRHWKKMWLTQTFEGKKRENCEFVSLLESRVSRRCIGLNPYACEILVCDSILSQVVHDGSREAKAATSTAPSAQEE